MKQVIKFGLSAIACVGLVYFLNHPIVLTEATIPPLGKFLNPFSGFWQNGKAEPAAESITLATSHLAAPVTIVYDQRMVPHIFAASNEDAFFTQGYLLAKHRLWQMDISTRASSGRLSEVMGKKLLKRDQLKRRRGMVFAAENALADWQQQPEFILVEAYTNGINAYLKNLSPDQYPIEFKLLDYAPEPWTPLKSAIFIKTMAEQLSSNENDLEVTNTRKLLGDSLFNQLYPLWYDEESPIIPSTVQYDFDPVTVSPTPSAPMGMIDHAIYEKPSRFLGSNNWAVSGKKTASGYPILCNDPHLGLTLPAIWYELQIHTPDLNVYGVALPGFPGVVIGFNEKSAWGMTNVGHDVLDWYKIKWATPDKSSYWLDGQKKPTEEKIERYEVKGLGTVYDTVHYTYWGPVTYETEGLPEQDLAMRWTAHDSEGNELKTFMGLNTSKNYDDYQQAITHFTSPAQNIVFASQEGDIAISVQGRLPLRSEGQGRAVQSGEQRQNDWQGYIPNAHLPRVKNPERGFVASANQVSTTRDYPYFYFGSSGSFEDYRGRTLNQKLAKMEQITLQDMKDMQTDVYSLKAAEALPGMINLLKGQSLTTDEERYLTILKNWDYEYRGEAQAPVIFDAWLREFYQQTWDEIYAFDEKTSVAFPSSRKTIGLLTEQPDHPYFDIQETETLETAKDVALRTYKKIAGDLFSKEKAGKSLTLTANKKIDIHHIGFIPAFGRSDLRVEGDRQTLNAIGEYWGPSWRMIVELGPGKPTAHGIYPGGQSGNPGSPFYDNMLEDWATGKYYPLRLMDAATDFPETHFAITSLQ